MPNQVKFPTVSSFFVALCMYGLIVVVLFIKLTFFTEPAKKYTDDKDAFMDIVMPELELAQTPKAPEQKKEAVKDTKPEPKEQKKEEKQQTTNKEVIPDEPLPTPSIPPVPKEEPKPEIPTPSEKPEPIKEQPKEENIEDLFKNIDKSKLKKDNGIAKPEPKVQSRKKSEQSSSQESSQASDIVKESLKRLESNTIAKAPKSQMTGTYDPLRGTIQKQIERRWRSYKANSNNMAKIAVLIDGSGNFSYEILELSYDEEFNNKVRECLERLTQEKFPFSPDGAINININLEDKLE